MQDIFLSFYYLFTLNFEEFILILNSLTLETTWLFFIIFCFISVLILLKLFGELGLYLYTIVAVIAANIQVLKIVKFKIFDDPVALGTILFASVFFCTDILNEHYSSSKARKNVILGFVGFLLMTLIMIITLGFKPISADVVGNEYNYALNIQSNLSAIFLPLPTLFIASMIAYLSSQYFDVWFYKYLLKITGKKNLWLRNNISTIISSLIDSFVFSLFAFIILSKNPLPLGVVILTYVFGTYFLRIFIALIDTPFIYLSKFFLPKIR